MKLSYTVISNVIVFAVAGLVAPAANAATTVTANNFSIGTTKTLSTKATSWRDPSFGNQGWTHNSTWGKFTASAGATRSITVTSPAGLHPGITVWYRGADDTAADNYVPDHFYTQNGNFVEFGATDESTGASIGNVSMQNVAYNYDQDAHTLRPWSTSKGLTDGVNGKVVLNFTPSKTGTYMFVVGGINPAASLSKTTFYSVSVSVN